MKRKILPFVVIFGSLAAVYACSSSSNDTPAPTPVPEGGSQPDTSTGDPDTSTGPDGTTPDGTTPDSGPNDNPIDGIATPAAVAALNGVVVVGPQWHGDGLFYAELVKDGKLIKLTPPATTAIIRGPVTGGNETLGTTYDEKAANFVSCEVAANAVVGVGTAHGGQIVRTAVGGTTGTAIVLTVDGGGAPAFDSPKNIAARHSDGMLYITDPGYQTDPAAQIVNNHIWRIKPATGEVFDERPTLVDGRPNGIAFALDQLSVYVTFTGEPGGVPAAKVVKYPVAAGGALGAGVPFGTVAADALADGIVVDTKGNVYVAVKTGVDVFKADGTKWGHIQTAKPVNGLAFGDADSKTLYMTTDPNGLMTVKVKFAGLLE